MYQQDKDFGLHISEQPQLAQDWLLADHPSDKARVDWHVETGDYFRTLSTIMGLLDDLVANAQYDKDFVQDKHHRYVEQMKKDLAYLHDAYTIEPKTGRDDK